MDLRRTPEEKAFRQKVLSWLETSLPEGFENGYHTIAETPEKRAKYYREFQRKQFEAGFAGLHYPKEYGGQGGTMEEEVIATETIAGVCAELKACAAGTHGLVGPTLLAEGTEEQKKEFIPKILDGTHIWCQGFSEPNAGSDLANLSTQAARKGDHYVVNGQKVWTSVAHISDYCILLVRTDSSGPKHTGMSYLLMDMSLPGIDVRPIKQIHGEAEFNEMFLDDVKVPANMLVGEEGKGWTIAITTLMFERTMGDANMAASYLRSIRNMTKMAKEVKRSGEPVIDNGIFRQKLAQSYIEATVLRYHGYRNLSKFLESGVPGPEGSIGKLFYSETNQRLAEHAMEMLGPNGQVMRGSELATQGGAWPFSFLGSKGGTIAGGTSEIQRNIIGERVLGLPKDASRVLKSK